jgi:hypothetical protein
MLLPAGDLYDTLYDAATALPAYVSLAALAAFLLLVPLYLSQRRDLQRLHAWMEREPSHPAADLAASEALLDRAEAELEAIFAGGPQPARGTSETVAAEPAAVRPRTPGPLPAAQRITHERPALERITMERAALQPHPRWRRLIAAVSQPAVLSTIAAVAVILGLVAIFGSGELLRGGEDSGRGPKPGAVVPGEVEVAVLNGTSVPGLAAKVGDDVRVNGFQLGAVTNSSDQFDQTVVMYEPGQQRAAKKVANDLGVKPVQPIDRQTEQSSGGADVVVIAGADRAQP